MLAPPCPFAKSSVIPGCYQTYHIVARPLLFTPYNFIKKVNQTGGVIMKHHRLPRTMAAFAVALLLGTAGTQAAWAGSSQVPDNCADCHTAEGKSVWGMIKPGTQTDSSFDVQVGKDVWQVKYDSSTDLQKFRTAKQLRDDKAVKVVPRKVKGNSIVAAEISYKPSIDFMEPEMVIELGDLDNLLKQDPKEANYMVFDVRGYGDYIDGHLPRAVSLPYYRMIQFKDRLPKDKDTLIVTYCNSYG